MTQWQPSGSGDLCADGIVSVGQLAPLAEARLDGSTWAYVAGGAGDESTLRANDAAWSHHGLLPRAMTDVSALSTRTTLLGLDLSHPILIAPTASHLRYHPEAELATLRGASAAESLVTLSTLGSTLARTFGDAATALGRPWWMQVYLQDDRSISRPILDAAVAGGAGALVLTASAAAEGLLLSNCGALLSTTRLRPYKPGFEGLPAASRC